MLRIVGISCAILAFGLFLSTGSVDAQAQNTKKNQMVKGTIKTVETDKDVLIVNQKVKNETVDRELSITPDVEFTITAKGETKIANGRNGLRMLEGLEGASVQIKCDKDVNVLTVKVKAK
jgi:hypothetical protein